MYRMSRGKISKAQSEYVNKEDKYFVQDDNGDWGDSDFDDLKEDDWDWNHELPNHIFIQEDNDANQLSSYQKPTIAADFKDDKDVESDDIDTLPESEDEDDQHKFPKFKMDEYGDKVRLDLGMILENDRKRIVVWYDRECPFHMRFSKKGSQPILEAAEFVMITRVMGLPVIGEIIYNGLQRSLNQS
ncbi:hypothetical protein KIW84_040800 [Lathyrus oleraceus]|uniref:Uncharacterized protein n=1 Tax=Pisum sativum TaxID=3888 RepID=A0A9D4X705_PEA|nr:hypothetical protein KIW84_040800 [Pisum sativum]